MAPRKSDSNTETARGTDAPAVVPPSVPGVETGNSPDAPDPLRGITGQPRENPDPTPDAHADPPPGEGLTPEDELREEHIRRKMTGAGGTVDELLVGKVKSAQEAVDNLQRDGLARLARQTGLTEEEAAKVRLMPVDLDAPPILGHKLASHDEHRSASDDERDGATKLREAVTEAKYPVTVTREDFEEAMRSEELTGDHKMELRQMARRNEVYVLGR